MRTTTIISAAAIAGLVAASPAPQQLDFNQLNAAPTVQTAPLLNGVANQTVTISSSAIAASISAQVTSVATASITGASASAAATAVANSKRSIEKRGLLCALLGINCSSSSSSSSTTSSSSSTVKTSSSSSSSAVKTSSSSALTSSSSSSSASSSSSSSSIVSSVTGTSTLQTSSGTLTSSSTTACPTTPENGTYCGFINPEDPCAPQPAGSGPTVSPDTVSAFLSYPAFSSMAVAAPTVVASTNQAGVSYVQTFQNLNTSSSANSYLGLYTLTSYDVAGCGLKCDNTALCTAFNIFIERDPSQNPTANDSTAPTVWGTWCPDPSSLTNYKCTLWGSNLDASSATNAGDWREQFQVVVTGSNGYDATNYTTPIAVANPIAKTTTAVVSSTSVAGASTKTSASTTAASAAATAAYWTAPHNCSAKAINAPNYWMGSKFFPGAFNPQVCADYAVFQNSANKQAAIAAGQSSYTPCQMFNSYYLHKNGVPSGTYCSLYDTQLGDSWATYQGGVSSSGDRYQCKQSWTYQLSTPDSGKC